MFRSRSGVVVVLAFGLIGAAGRPAAADPSMAAMRMGAAAPTPDTQMRDGMQRMQQDMKDAPMTGDPDRDFVSMMLPHHQGAVEMAKVELQHGKDPALLKLARGIVAAQEREIGFMKGWLAAHPATEPKASR